MLLKELQSLGLDVKVLDENRREVQLMETTEYGNTDINAIIASDRNFAFESNESFEANGFSTKSYEDAANEAEGSDDGYEDEGFEDDFEGESDFPEDEFNEEGDFEDGGEIDAASMAAEISELASN